MATPSKTPNTVDEIKARKPGGDVFALPDIPDMMSAWMSLTSPDLQAWQTELTSFMARRLDRDRMMMQRFAGCHDLVEAAKVQQDWFADAFASYVEESRRLATIAIGGAAASVVPKGGRSAEPRL